MIRIQGRVMITPSDNIIAGDYDITIQAVGDRAMKEKESRVTGKIGTLMQYLGGILVVAAGLFLIYRKHDRR
jgi:uncharacterized membrane protein